MTAGVPPTAEELDEWEKRANAATEGPWGLLHGQMSGDIAIAGETTWIVVDGSLSIADAEFVAAARGALPRLLAEVRRLRGDAGTECEREDCRKIADTAGDVYCDITGGLLSYPTYDARTILTYAEDYTRKLIDEAIAEDRATRGDTQ